MKEQELDIRKYINHQNRTLYKKLTNIYDIKLHLSPKLNSWSVDNNKPIIRTPKDDLNIASFTHELLHIYLDYLDITPKEDIYYKLFNSDVLLSINRALLFDHIYNVSCHKKMYPFFRDMGFQDKDFVSNNGVFFKNIDYLIIKICKKLNILSKLWISLFIGHFFSMKNDIVEGHRHHNHRYLYKLARLDRSLYRIIYDFDSKWSKQISLNCWYNYRILSDDLYDWLKKNRKLKK